jgi:hypothetical protein
VTSYRPPINLPDDHMRMIGIIAALWEHLDVTLQNAVAEIMSFKLIDVRLLTENLTVPGKLDILTAHARQSLTKDQLPAFTKAIRAIQEAYGQRNTYVHAKWHDVAGDPNRPWRFAVRTKGGKISITQTPTELSELEAAARQIWDAREELIQILESYGIFKT